MSFSYSSRLCALILSFAACCTVFASCGNAKSSDAKKSDSSKAKVVTTDAEDSKEVTTDAQDSKTVTTTAVTTAPPPADPVPTDPIERTIYNMSVHEKVCQLFIVTPEELSDYDGNITEIGEGTQAALKEYPVGGVILFSDNLVYKDQTTALIADYQAFAEQQGAQKLFIAVDEEGGSVARCAEKLGVTTLNDMYTYRAEGTQKAYDNAKIIGSYLKELGFNLDFAPVADTWSNKANTVIGTRAYSDNYLETAELIPSAVNGFHEGGVLCTLKHFPGHGDTTQDTHLGPVSTDKELSELESREYLAFMTGISAGADMVMASHITMNSVDSLPASLSPTMLQEELRNKLRFEGVIVTDSLSMGAITDNYTSAEAAVKAFTAGADILLMPEDLEEAVSGIEEAVEAGTITQERLDESLRRILQLKAKI